MSDSIADEQAREIQSWPSPTLSEFRDALFAVACGDVVASLGFSVDEQTLELVKTAIAAGRLVDAGRISDREPGGTALLADAKSALKAGQLLAPRTVLPIVVSIGADRVESSVLLVVRPIPGNETTASVVLLTARRSQDGRILLTQTGALAGSDGIREMINVSAAELCVVLRYLSTFKAAVTPAVHPVASPIPASMSRRLSGFKRLVRSGRRPLLRPTKANALFRWVRCGNCSSKSPKWGLRGRVVAMRA
jgi:hypothetical protein